MTVSGWQGCEEGTDVLDEQAGGLQRGEMTAGVEVAPVHDVVGLFGVASDGDVLGEDGHPGGNFRWGGPVAGTFQPTAEQLAMAEEMQALGTELFERARATGQLRDDITYLDVEFLLEFLARVRLGDADRTAELRQRHLSVIIDGLRSTQPTPLPGEPPTWQEQTARWITR